MILVVVIQVWYIHTYIHNNSKVPAFKLLSVFLDENLPFNDHFCQILNQTKHFQLKLLTSSTMGGGGAVRPSLPCFSPLTQNILR